ncbi:MAG: hypothetical protein ACLPXB_05810 [Thiobacillaceae bacterium]
MRPTPKHLAVAVILATTQLADLALAQTTTAPTAPSGQAARAGVSEEPQRHFDNAVEAYTKKDYTVAANEIRKAARYLHVEAGRATGNARKALDGSVVELGKLAGSVEKGAVKDERIMDTTFAKADHALALAHRTKAAESWTRREYDKAGDELKAAAHDLDRAAGWAGTKAKAGVSRVVTDTKELGNKLATGATWTRDEVGRGFNALGHALNKFGQKIGAKEKAEPVKSGSGSS